MVGLNGVAGVQRRALEGERRQVDLAGVLFFVLLLLHLQIRFC